MPECVLLIDDDQRLTMALQIRLQAGGYRVITANCGEDGLELARQNRPQLIVLDIHMPGMDGYAVCRGIRSDAGLRAIPVLVISAIEQESSRRAVIDAGASQFLPKPYEVTDVLAAIRSLIDNRSAMCMNENSCSAISAPLRGGAI
jgi:DNA-binding response OmpR family regulator